MKLKIPFYVIGYNLTKVFSIHEESTERDIIPVFTRASVANRYWKWFSERFSVEIQVFIVSELDKAIDLLTKVAMVSPETKHVILNPSIPDGKKLKCESLQNVIVNLRLQKVRKPRHLRKPGGNGEAKASPPKAPEPE